jgi:hypothetical protein
MEKRRGAAASGGWSALPADVLARVLSRLAGDVSSLCAAACVAPAWRDAAAEPRLWVCLKLLPDTAGAEHLTDERLKALVARSRGLLASLDVSGARQLTNKGLTAVLQQPHALTAFSAAIVHGALTASGVVRALAAQRGRMRKVSVQGLDCGPRLPVADDTAEFRIALISWHTACNDVIAALRALMAPDGVLVGDRLCSGDGWYKPCTVLCGRANVCANCNEALCADHQDGRFVVCIWCSRLFCVDICGGVACEPCFRARVSNNPPN